MIYDQIMVRYGDLTLKGKNQREFLTREGALIRRKLEGLDVEIHTVHDRVYIELKNEDINEVLKHLNYVSGISSYSFVKRVDNDIDVIVSTSLELLEEEIKGNETFKVSVRRANKRFKYDSMEATRLISSQILKSKKFPDLKVDVHNPEVTLHVEIRDEGCFLFLNEQRAMGGFPVGVAGKGILLLSGGLDSPVAGYLAMKQGIEIECLHFESTPLTSIESSQKVVDLAKILANYAPYNKINLLMVPFKELHQEILLKMPESYKITIMRRMMYRIADKIARKRNAYCIVNGESVGQVASQTLQSLQTINAVTNLPVIRPLCTTDKVDIVKTSYKIGTYQTSIRPFEDCCTVYVPKNPATAPKLEKAIEYEKGFDFEELVDFCVNNTRIVPIEVNTELDLASLGFEVRDVLENYKTIGDFND